jgi:hypothetical protein
MRGGSGSGRWSAPPALPASGHPPADGGLRSDETSAPYPRSRASSASACCRSRTPWKTPACGGRRRRSPRRRRESRRAIRGSLRIPPVSRSASCAILTTPTSGLLSWWAMPPTIVPSADSFSSCRMRLVLRVETQELVFEIVLPPVVALHPVERDVENAEHARGGQQADQRDRHDRAVESGLQSGNVTNHHQFADVAPPASSSGTRPRAASARRHRSRPSRQQPPSIGACRMRPATARWSAPARHGVAKRSQSPFASSGPEPALPLFRTQEFLVYQHRQIHRQAVAHLIDQVLDFLADFE